MRHRQLRPDDIGVLESVVNRIDYRTLRPEMKDE